MTCLFTWIDEQPRLNRIVPAVPIIHVVVTGAEVTSVAKTSDYIILSEIRLLVSLVKYNCARWSLCDTIALSFHFNRTPYRTRGT